MEFTLTLYYIHPFNNTFNKSIKDKSLATCHTFYTVINKMYNTT